MGIRFNITVATAVLALALPMMAHHSGAAVFDNTKKIDLTGGTDRRGIRSRKAIRSPSPDRADARHLLHRVRRQHP